MPKIKGLKSRRDLGYGEGKNIMVEYRYIEGRQDRVPGLVGELVRLKVDVLVLVTLPSIRAAKQLTQTIPIVMVTTQDPVAAGIVDNLARPGGNITGLTRLTRNLSGKRLELLKEVIPGKSRVGVLWDADSPGPVVGFKEYEAAASALNVALQSLEVRGPNPDLEGAFRGAINGRVSALITVSTSLLTVHQRQIVELAIKTDCLQCPSRGTWYRPAASCPIRPTMLNVSDVQRRTWTKS